MHRLTRPSSPSRPRPRRRREPQHNRVAWLSRRDSMQPLRRLLSIAVLTICALTAAAAISEARPQGSEMKSPAPLYVATFVDLMPQNKEPGTKAIKDYVTATRREPGIVRIEAIAQVGGRDNHLVIFEVWK